MTEQEEMNAELFVNLMKQFYKLGWLSGSSGGMACSSFDTKNVSSEQIIFYSPSSVQKERLKADDLFILNAHNGKLIKRPKNEKIKESACTPLFNLILNETDSQCVIHTHSKYSNLLTQLIENSEFQITDQEMIKGILKRKDWKNYSNFDRLIVPIIENSPQEFMLIPALKEALEKYSDSCGVLVRNHGFFVWGPSWQRTKIMLECYEYLFELACEMIRHKIPLIKSIAI